MLERTVARDSVFATQKSDADSRMGCFSRPPGAAFDKIVWCQTGVKVPWRH
jgi:hypothetical protein